MRVTKCCTLKGKIDSVGFQLGISWAKKILMLTETIFVIKGQEKSKDCEKDDNIACDHKGTWSYQNLKKGSSLFFCPKIKYVNIKLTTPARHRTIGKANADSTIPVVKNAQASFKDDDVLPRSPDLLEIMVGMGANT